MIRHKYSLKTSAALLDGLTHAYRKAAGKGGWAKLSGRLAVDIGSFFIGIGEVKVDEKGAQAANTVAHAAEGINVAAHVVEGTGKVDTTAKELEVVEHTSQEAARLGDTAEANNAAERTAREIDTAASAGDVDDVSGKMAGPKSTAKATKNFDI